MPAKLELKKGLEPSTGSLQNCCSTIELFQRIPTRIILIIGVADAIMLRQVIIRRGFLPFLIQLITKTMNGTSVMPLIAFL
jgi:hypothetical protein